MDKENCSVIYTGTHMHIHSGMLFSFENEGNLAICRNLETVC